jgi:hypothetical protein
MRLVIIPALFTLALGVAACGGPSQSSSAVETAGDTAASCTCEGGSGGGGCTLTQGYWKNHPQAWPVSSLTIGGVVYTQAELLTLFSTAPAGDASLVLGHQLFAAMLNVASGAMPPSATTSAIADAQAWMTANLPAGGRLPYGVSSSSSAGAAAVQLSSALDQFNMGGAGLPHCSDGPGSSSGSTCTCGDDAGSGSVDAGCDGDTSGTKPPPIGSGDPTGTGTDGTGVL